MSDLAGELLLVALPFAAGFVSGYLAGKSAGARRRSRPVKADPVTTLVEAELVKLRNGGWL